MESDQTKIESKVAGRLSRAGSAGIVTIPDHTLIRPVGEGAYGEVWLARNVMGTYRAVKIVYRSSFSSGDPYEREFSGIRKYEPVSRSNDGLMDILQVGRNDDKGYFYYVMELADDAQEPRPTELPPPQENGKPLSRASESRLPGRDALEVEMSPWDLYSPRTLRSEVERRGQLPAAECVRIALSLCHALAHLHGRGLLHRDIKPANLIFVDGAVKLADIGLVADETEARTFVGTEGFIPPEGPNSRQADLFSLGMVLYEISSGKKAKDFPEPSLEMVKGPEHTALLELNAIILKACAADPSQRYASADEMGQELSMLERGKSVMARHARRRLLVAVQRVAATLAAVVGLGLAGYFWARQPVRISGAPTRLRVNDAEFWVKMSTRPKLFDFSPDGQRIVFAGAKGLWIWDAATQMNRPFPWAGLGSFEKPVPRGQWYVPRVRGLPCWAPDGSNFAVQLAKDIGGTPEGPVTVFALFLINAHTGETMRQITTELPERERVWDFCWLPDGKAITYVDFQRRLYTVALGGGRTLWVDANISHQQAIGLSGYSPDANWLLLYTQPDGVATSGDLDIWLMPHAGGRAVPIVRRAGTDAFPIWGPDAETVFFASSGGYRLGNTWGLWEIGVDLKTGSPKSESRSLFITPGQRIHHPKFVAGGKRLVYGVERTGTTVLLSADGDMSHSVALFRGGERAVSAPDGQTIYFAGEQKDQQGVYALDRHGTGPPRKLSHLIPLADGVTRGGLSLSPDGEQLALFSYDESRQQFGIFVLPTAGGDPALVHELTEYKMILPIWSPDSQWLAFAVDKNLYRISRDGKVRELLATLYRWQGWSLRWSPDGKAVAALAYASPAEWEEKAGVFVVDVDRRTSSKLSPDSEDKYKEGLEWHPSGQYLTYFFSGPEAHSAQIRRAYLDGRPTDLMIDQENHWDYVGVWHPDGQSFIFTSTHCKGPSANLHRYDAVTGEINHGIGSGGLPGWNRDGKTVVWTTGNEERWFEELEYVR